MSEHKDLRLQVLESKDGLILQAKCGYCEFGSFGFGAGIILDYVWEKEEANYYYYDELLDFSLDNNVLMIEANHAYPKQAYEIQIGNCSDFNKRSQDDYEEGYSMAGEEVFVSYPQKVS